MGRDLKVLDEVNEKVSNSAGWFGCIHEYNSRRKNTIVNKISKLSAGLAGMTIGVLGLTYKPGTSTLRRSLPLEIVNQLVEKSANVRVYDPKADYSELSSEPNFIIVKSIRENGYEKTIIAGGPHPTTSYQEVLKDSNVDICAIGEGEMTLKEIIDKLMKNKGSKLDITQLNAIDGIAYNKANL